MKKKVISAVIVLCLVLSSAAALPQNAFVDSTSITASAEVLGDWEYNILDDGTAQITGYKGSKSSVSIPSECNGKKVSRIGIYALASCNSFTNVVIPDTVTSIGENAFTNCKNLNSVTIPNSVTSIEVYAFDGCTSLTNITIPSSVDKIGSYIFDGCKKLTSINVDKNNKNYSSIDGVLYNKNQTSLIICPIGKNAISIPNSVTSLNRYAFWNCENLTEINLPSSVKETDLGTFYGCKKLTSIVLPDGITQIGASDFSGCENLKSIYIPDSVSIIDEMAFCNCKNLESIVIPNGVTSISRWVFDGCTNLKTVAIPSSVKSIDDAAFEGCKDFTIKCIADSTAEKYAEKNNIPYEIVAVVSRLAGASRFDTAVEISKAGFETADTVVLAYGMNYADALAGVSLAKAMNAPILLTNLKELPAETLAEIKRLEATNVVILGGPGAVGTEVEKALTDNKLNVERIAGASRFETATKIAEKMQKLNGDKAPEDVFFVYYNGFADALSVSTVAAAKGAPVIYLQTNGELDDATASYLASVKGKVKNAYVIGGDGVISDAMMNKAGTALGLTPTRVFGTDRFATCVAVNEKFANVLNGNSVCVATGMDFPDALAGGVFAAIQKAPLFLINGKAQTLILSDKQKAYLKTLTPNMMYVLGGIGVVPDSHVKTVADAWG